MMLDGRIGLRSIRNRLVRDSGRAVPGRTVDLRVADGRLVIDGELSSLATKRQMLERAASIAGVEEVVDRLRVSPGRRVSDAEMRDELLRALLDEPAFAVLAIQQRAGSLTWLLRQPSKCLGFIGYELRGGVVILTGVVPGLGHKRLAGVLAWWVEGTRDVVNAIAVEPAERDDDTQIADAVRLALDKDPRLAGERVLVAVAEGVVTLSGHVRGRAERERAECDAWYVLGVRDVVNRLIARV